MCSARPESAANASLELMTVTAAHTWGPWRLTPRVEGQVFSRNVVCPAGIEPATHSLANSVRIVFEALRAFTGPTYRSKMGISVIAYKPPLPSPTEQYVNSSAVGVSANV